MQEVPKQTDSGPASPPPDLAEIKRQSASGGTVSLLMQGLNAVILFASTVILARLLDPRDFGIMAMAAAVAAFANIFSTSGLLVSAVCSPTLDRTQQNNLFWINTGLGMASTAAISLCAPLLAYLFRTPELTPVLVAVSSICVIGNLSLQSSTILVRDLRFGRQRTASVAGVVVMASVSIALAAHGQRYWSFVWGQIAGAAVTTLLLFVLSSFRPGWPSRPLGVRNILKLGAYNTAFELFNYFHRNLDHILVGRYCGAVQLGFYDRAYKLLMFPVNNIRWPIGSVAYPLMSRLRSDPKALREYYLHLTSLLALLTMPLIAFLFVASKPLIVLLYGQKWVAVSPIFSLLALAAFVQPVSGLANNLLVVLDQGRRNLQCGIFCTSAFVLSFVIGLPWGPKGVALAYMVTNYIVLFPWLYWAFLHSPVTVRDFVKACGFAALTSAVAAGLSLYVGTLIAGYSDFMQISVFAVCFATVFACSLGLTPAGKRQVAIWREMIDQFKSSEGVTAVRREESKPSIREAE
jgi:polysaccharide transporter, PST family